MNTGLYISLHFNPDVGKMFLKSFAEVPVPPRADVKEVIIEGLKAIGLFLFMVLGMVSKWLWDSIEVGRSKYRKLKLDYLGLSKPLLISPIVFLFLWILMKDQSVGLVHYLISYQNGFFWQSILYPKNWNRLINNQICKYSVYCSVLASFGILNLGFITPCLNKDWQFTALISTLLARPLPRLWKPASGSSRSQKRKIADCHHKSYTFETDTFSRMLAMFYNRSQDDFAKNL